MTPERYEEVRQAYLEVCELNGSDRRAYLEALQLRDPELRKLVQAFLDDESKVTARLTTPLAETPIESIVTVPEKIGQYRVLEKVGQGAMGSIYRARQESPPRDVALKLLSTPFPSEERHRRFHAEAQILGKLQHPNIAQIIEAGTYEYDNANHPFFVMEFIKGPTLNTYVCSASLDLRGQLELMATICDAVDYAHQQGVVHRDLKPSNILVDEQGQPKVLDFGVARVMGSEAAYTLTGDVVGTIQYMSPEQVTGHHSAIGPASDVYTLGVIAYELITGQPPYDVSDQPLAEAARIISDQSPARMKSTRYRIPADLETIIRKALEKDWRQRYSSAREFGDDLRRYLHDEPIHARPPSAVYQLRKFTRRNKVLVGSMAAMLVLSVIASVVIGLFALEEGRQRRKANRRFDEVRQLANALMHDVYDQISDLPGATAPRNYIIQICVDYLNSLTDEVDDDPTLLHEVQQAWIRVAEVQGGYGPGNVGAYQDALASFERALDLGDRLVQVDPDNDAFIQTRARAMFGVADVKSRLDEPDAEDVYWAGVNELRPLIKRNPTSKPVANALGHGISHLQSLVMARSAFDVANQLNRERLQFLDDCLTAWPEDEQLLRLKADTHKDLGWIHYRQNRLELALQEGQKVLALKPKLEHSNPAEFSVSWTSLAANAHAIIGQAKWNKRDPSAMQSFETATGMLGQVVTADDQNASKQELLATMLSMIGDSYARPWDDFPLGKVESIQRAIDHFEDARDIIESLQRMGRLGPMVRFIPDHVAGMLDVCRSVLETQDQAPFEPAMFLASETTVTLLEPGAGPRRLHRVRLDDSDSRSFLMTQHEASEVKYNGVALGRHKIPALQMSLAVRPHIDTAPEAPQLQLTIEDAQLAESTEDAAPEIITKLREPEAERLQELEVSIASNDSGQLTGHTLMGGSPIDQTGRQYLKELMFQMLIVWPSKPIGVGARWRVERSIPAPRLGHGARTQQTIEYTLTAVAGTQLTLNLNIQERAPEDQLVLMQLGAESRLLSGEADIRAELSMVEGDLMPRAFRLEYEKFIGRYQSGSIHSETSQSLVIELEEVTSAGVSP